jgi:hypothetical protein
MPLPRGSGAGALLAPLAGAVDTAGAGGSDATGAPATVGDAGVPFGAVDAAAAAAAAAALAAQPGMPGYWLQSTPEVPVAISAGAAP